MTDKFLISEESHNDPTTSLAPTQSNKFRVCYWILLLLEISIWGVLMKFFMETGFGMPFLAVSILYFICRNLRTRPKIPGEVSAYSVFNENCEAIDGTVTADQLQREMFGGMFSLGR